MRQATSLESDRPTTVQPGAMSALIEELVRAPEPDRPPGDRLAPGARVGRFQIVREIGRGGFGVVYEARDLELGRSVAFKVVRPGLRRELREGRLLLEAEAAARLSHPNIVTLFDLGRSEHGPYLVLELLHGETLGARLARGALGSEEAFRIGAEVARGLAHAHASSVVHRDLSPGNVFLCEDGRVKVLDLGMAHAFGRELVRGGTPGHMAPEQRDGSAEDARTDVFALGALLLAMTGGAVPERGLGPGERLRMPRGGRLPRVLQRMLARDRSRRFANAGEALAALEQAIPDRARARRLLWRALALLALVAAVAGVVLARRPVPLALSGASLAVLPFEDASDARDHGHVAEGLAADLASELARTTGLRVAGHASALRARALAAPEAAARLRVGSLLSGRVRPEGGALLVSVRLVRGEDGRELWAQDYQAGAEGVFSLQVQIARAVAGALRLQPAPPAPSGAAPPAEAVELAWRTRRSIDAGQFEGEQLAWAQRAAALAPHWGRARALLGQIRFLRIPSDGFEAGCRGGLADLDQALLLDPAQGDAWAWRGYVRFHCAIELEAARLDTERALTLSPAEADVLRRAGAVSLFSARREEAIGRFRRAADLDPLTPSSWTWLARAYWSALRFGEARAAVERAMALDPGGWHVVLLGHLALEEGHAQEALGHFERASPANRDRGRAMALHDLGRQAEAEEALEALTRRAPTSVVGRAQVFAWWGDRERAFEELAKRGEEGNFGKVEMLHDPLLRSLRADPRWAPMLRRFGFP